jgi:hypothetical protein
VVVGVGGLALALMLFPPPRDRARRPPAPQAFGGDPQTQARDLVDSLYAGMVRKDKVLAYLENDRDLPRPLRDEALQLAKEHQPNPLLLNNGSWYVVVKPGHDLSEYHHALVLAEEAVRLAPGEGTILNTLGVAQYRVGRYREALETLTQSDRLNANRQGARDPADIAFLAMSHYQLGRAELGARAFAFLGSAGGQGPFQALAALVPQGPHQVQALAELRELRDIVVGQRFFARQDEVEGNFREAQQLIGKQVDPIPARPRAKRPMTLRPAAPPPFRPQPPQN